jgi:hypothetical protein
MNLLPDRSPFRCFPAAAARIVVVLMVTVLLVGCGKKGDPSPPTDQPRTYPRSYPSE